MAAGQFWLPGPVRLIDDFGNPTFESDPWLDHEADLNRMLKARQITREAFMKLNIWPKPTFVENLIYCGILRERHGDLSQVEGFDRNGNFILPKSAGIIGPVMRGWEIARVQFWPYSKAFKPKKVTASLRGMR